MPRALVRVYIPFDERRTDAFNTVPPLSVDMEDSDSDKMYCAEHDMKTPMYEDTGDPHCPYCREERRLRAEREHMLTRDRTVEPW